MRFPADQSTAHRSGGDVGPATTPEVGTPPGGLDRQRLTAVTEAVVEGGGRAVVDVGCGDGRLLEMLAARPELVGLCGIDPSPTALAHARRRLEQAAAALLSVALIEATLEGAELKLAGYDTATVVEVIEHFDRRALAAFSATLFGRLHPDLVVVTTPNREHNVHLEHLGPSGLRHHDHRFEWTRAQFGDWAASVADRHRYRVELDTVGSRRFETGGATQLAVFRSPATGR